MSTVFSYKSHIFQYIILSDSFHNVGEINIIFDENIKKNDRFFLFSRRAVMFFVYQNHESNAAMSGNSSSERRRIPFICAMAIP